MTEEVENEALKYTMVSDDNLSPLPTANDRFGSGTQLQLPPAARPFSPVDHHNLILAGWPTSSRQAMVKELAELRLQVLA
jgi:hypothetical protein